MSAPQVNPKIECAHGCVFLQDSCPSCDHMSETPHVPEMATVTPAWTSRPWTSCLHCQQPRSHRVHTGGAA